MRPQGTVFSHSARNRDSVMNLGTIAHLQYYFARTGLLDGKGAQLQRAAKKKLAAGEHADVDIAGLTDSMNPYTAYLNGPAGRDSTFATADLLFDDGRSGDGLVESPIDHDDTGAGWDHEPMMLPPTVSTYKHRTAYVPPPPDMVVLRRELREALDDADKVLREAERAQPTSDGADGETECTSQTEGFYEIQGLHVLDLVTLAIRAAKNYYTAHEQPQRLYSLRSERRIRSDLLQVLDTLKRMATRNFAGGMKTAELAELKSWCVGINKLLNDEEEQEKAEFEERERWSWREGDWTGKEREREWLFLNSFDTDPEELPEWTEPAETNGETAPTPFLSALRNGLRLCHLHNTMVKKSNRPFGEIKNYHTDTAKPYRCADNLRYWIKASELRWETKLTIDVAAVVHGEIGIAWKQFDQAVLKWCKAVREEIIRDWQEKRKASLSRPPTLRIDSDITSEASVTVA